VATGYRAIAEMLRAAIERGDFQPGSRIPTEHELAEQYGVARETVRRALAVLKAGGLLVSATSQGTVVAEPPVRLSVTRYADVTDGSRSDNHLGPWETACAQQGVPGRAEVVGVNRAAADASLAAQLDVPEGAELVHRAREMWAGDDVAQLQDSWLPAELVEGTPLAEPGKVVGGVYAAMLSAGLVPATFTESLSARLPTREEQQRMRLGDAAPVLEVWRITRDGAGRPLEALRTVADARRSLFVYDDLPVQT
jgi:GntR family transcriptional regulator